MRDKACGDMLEAVRTTIENYNMLSGGETVIVGLSGGADSVALTYALLELCDEYKISLEAVHINHNIRGEEALRDEEFVQSFCKKYSIPLTVESIDVPTLAAEKKISCEQAGREVRYAAFSKQIGGRKNCKIATAHTLSDLMETTLFNMARGTGIKGLQGIVPVRDNIIRPLIGQTREQIEEYCKSRGLDFVTDSTNLSDEYTRNKIRHNIIPELYEINPSLDTAMQKLSVLARQDDEFITLMAKEAVESARAEDGYCIEQLSKLHPAILSRAVMIICKGMPDFRQTELIIEIIKCGSGAVNISGGGRATIKNNLLYCENNIQNVNKKDPEELWSVSVKGETTPLPDGRILKITPYEKNYDSLFLKVNKLLLNNAILCDTLLFNLTVRNRRAGDCFSAAGRNGTKTLKKLFNELKISVEERSKRAILECDGQIMWIEGIGASKNFSPKEKNFLNDVIYIVSITDNKTEDEHNE